MGHKGIVMKSELSSRQQASILLITLMLHALLLIAMFILKQQQEAYERRLIKEPIIIIEEQQKPAPQLPENQQPTPMPKQEWVAIESASPPVPVTQEQIQEQDTDTYEEESTEEEGEAENVQKAPTQEAIADALQVAEQILGKSSTSVARAAPVVTKKDALKKDTPAKNIAKVKESGEKNKITFAQLAQGFAQHIQGTLSVKSGKHGTASIDQLKQMHYCQKILACVVNSYKINKGSLPISKKMGNTVIQLALNQNGSIYLLRILQSSGNIGMDSFITHMFQDASSSFPPLPASFATPYQLPLFNFDTIEVFQSTNYWHIDTSRP